MMPDRETVITHLQLIHTWAASARECDLQFFTAKLLEDIAQWTGDAIALLKEQDVKPMIENEIGWNCPSCGMNLIGKSASGYPCNLIDLPEDEPIHFCPKCGQAVKCDV